MTSESLAPARSGGRLAGYDFEPHRCFACGELNEHGLHLILHADPSGCWTELSLDERFQGWDSVAHGGIVATILDEVMAWSVIGRGTWGVTARLNLAFKRPIATDHPIRAEGWVVDDRRRVVRTAGHVLDARTREVLATGEGTFVAVPADQLAVLQARYRLRASDADGASGADGADDTDGATVADAPELVAR